MRMICGISHSGEVKSVPSKPSSSCSASVSSSSDSTRVSDGSICSSRIRRSGVSSVAYHFLCAGSMKWHSLLPSVNRLCQPGFFASPPRMTGMSKSKKKFHRFSRPSRVAKAAVPSGASQMNSLCGSALADAPL